MANVVPFWNGMAALMALAAAGASTRMARSGQVVGPRWSDLLLGVALGVATWGAVRLLLPSVLAVVPGLAEGFTLVAGYARQEPPAWAFIGMAAIAVAEELVWRWFLPWRLGALGRYRAAVAVAFPYAAMHLFTGRYYLAPSALGFGLLWGLTTAWRGSPWLAVAWHVVFDWLVFLVAPPMGI
ncbi:MAG: abortive infection protein [Cyanobacteria bacterium RYN_339]|nr:abortive infection protein [Cyanobacteria bacterium RYN_339]